MSVAIVDVVRKSECYLLSELAPALALLWTLNSIGLNLQGL